MFVRECGNSTFEQCETILVNLTGNNINKSVVVSPLEALGSLGMEGDCRYVHNGKVLSPSFSLKFLGVNDGDTIYVVPVEKHKPTSRSSMNTERLKRVDESTSLKCMHSELNECDLIRSGMDPSALKESQRITDFFRLRIECNPGTFRKVCARFLEWNARERNVISLNKTVIPEKKACPSTDILPEVWSSMPGNSIE